MKLLFKNIFISFIFLFYKSINPYFINHNTSIASNETYYHRENPANLKDVKNIIFYNNFYYPLKTIKNQTGVAFNIWQTKYAIETQINSTSIHNPTLEKVYVSIALPFLKKYAIGLNSNISNTNNNLTITPTLGLISEFNFNKKIFWNFGIYNIILGLSFYHKINKQNILDNSLLIGSNLTFFKIYFITLKYNNTIEFKNNLNNILFSHHFKLYLSNYASINYEVLQNESNITKHILGLTLSIDLPYNFYPSLTISYPIPNYKKQNEESLNDLAFLIQLKLPMYNDIIYPFTNNIKYTLEPNNYITPNHDNYNDILKILLTKPYNVKLKYWNVVIKNKKQEIISTILPDVINADTYDLPQEITWNATNFKGHYVADGIYTLELILILPNNKEQFISLGNIHIDTKEPIFNILESTNKINTHDLEKYKEDNIFNFYKFKIKAISTDIDYYLVSFYNNEHEKIYDKIFDKNIHEITFTPLELKSIYLQSNSIFINITAIDNANNISKNHKFTHNFYNETIPVLDISHTNYNYNKDNGLKLYPYCTHKEIKKWEINIYHQKTNTIVHKLKSKDHLLENIIWDVKSKNDTMLKNGIYELEFIVTLKNNINLYAHKILLTLDNTAPRIIITSPNIYFTPDNNNIDDTAPIHINFYDSSPILKYLIQIKNDNNQIVYSTTKENIKQLYDIFYWNGVTNNKINIESNTNYNIQIIAEDESSNIGYSNIIQLKTNLIYNNISYKIQKKNNLTNIKFENILFKLNQSDVSYDETKKIDDIIKFIKKNNFPNLYIYGHSDSTGSLKYNKILSHQRAISIKKYFQENGIDNNIVTFECGPKYPLSLEHNLNRRAEISILELH